MICIKSRYILLVLLTYLMFSLALFSQIVLTSNNLFSWFRMRDFGNIIVIEDLLWEKWPIKYRNVLIANESEYFMNYVLYRLKELDKISDIFNMYPENIIRYNDTYASIIKEIKDILINNGFKEIKTTMYSNNIIKITLHRDRDIGQTLINEIKEVLDEAKLRNTRIVINVLPFNTYSSSVFAVKLDYAIRAVSEKYKEDLGNARLSLGTFMTATVMVSGKPNVSIKKIIDFIREELGDDTTPFILILHDIKWERINDNVSSQESTVNDGRNNDIVYNVFSSKTKYELYKEYNQINSENILSVALATVTVLTLLILINIGSMKTKINM